MNKESERYNTRVEIPISVILETIFSDDNEDVETLCRWAKHYGFVDLIKENENDKLGYYKLQDDYTKQSFYIWLSKEERKQYEYEDTLLDRIEEKDKEIERLSKEVTKYDEILCERNNEVDRLNNIINELEKTFVNDDKIIKEYNIEHPERPADNYSIYYLDKLKELKEGK